MMLWQRTGENDAIRVNISRETGLLVFEKVIYIDQLKYQEGKYVKNRNKSSGCVCR
jgi:hypothetical protein